MPGGLGDETLPHLPFPEFSFAVNVSGPEDMRRVCRMFLKYGVDSIKLNLSGDNLVPHANAKTTWMTDAEVQVAVEEAKLRGKRVAVHARSGDSVKQAVAARRRGDLSRELHGQRGARPARSAQGARYSSRPACR